MKDTKLNEQKTKNKTVISKTNIKLTIKSFIIFRLKNSKRKKNLTMSFAPKGETMNKLKLIHNIITIVVYVYPSIYLAGWLSVCV